MKRVFNLTEDKRTSISNSILGAICAFVSGGINAGGFIILGQYTSHVTGIVASAADEIALNQLPLAMTSLGFVGIFFLGAFLASVLVQFARLRKLHSQFALAFLMSGAVMITLGLWTLLHEGSLHKNLILTLGFFFSMGIQNATVTKLSNSEIRSTHMTGIVTDLGVEASHWLFNREPLSLIKLGRLLLILLSFFVGGICGAFSFQSTLGTSSLFFYGGVLVVLSIVPVYKDTHIRMRYLKKSIRARS